MALSGSTVWEVEYGGADTNGGGFVTGASGTDWSQQSAAQYALTNGVTNGTTTVATTSASTDMVGNIAYIAGGTGSITGGWYQITAVSAGVSLTVDRSTGLTTGTGVTINIGGALATPGNAAALATVSSMKIWWKYSSLGQYVMTSATAGAGGPISLAAITIALEGYDQTRGDRTGNQPALSWGSVSAPGSATYMLVPATGNRQWVSNCAVNGNSVNNVCGINGSGSRNSVNQCTASNCSGTNGIGILGSTSAMALQSCQANSCLTGFSGGNFAYCFASGCTTGFSNGQVHVCCLSYNNSSGFVTSSALGSFYSCTADSNSTNGFSISITVSFISCIASNHTGGSAAGFSVGTSLSFFYGCFGYNNTSNISGTPIVNESFVTLTAQPYVTAGSQFAPNAAAGGGALLRGVGLGIPGQTDNNDAGAVQHADPSGSSVYPQRPYQVGF
jgi:hypothetical protein